ncbi:MAG: GatB/YqeY domain-containing protein [Reyranella sp.]|uniref:GatB/YqeY domain-containing protein n=1 Tax=Reyranella sp. TaxID=1929291 RepID=UPI001AD59001|nr:GatB/YqeY domain-containing protein [Reyranella sp.]MBN9088228.1 GatB/YqeY domain-containing protein [Reyranella sp.]
MLRDKSLRDQLNEALKDAMRARDAAALGTIRLILAKLKEVDIASRTEANREGVADDKILSMMQGMIKQRNESIALYDKGGRQDLVDKEKAEIVVIERFLPQQMDEAAVQAAVNEAIAAAGAKSIKDMGGVMAALKTRYAGQMDFAKASAVVKKTLAG